MTTPAAPVPAPDPNPHKEADDSEQIYFDGPPAAVASLGQFILFTLIAIIVIATPFLIARSNNTVPGWAYPVAIVIGLILFVIPWVKLRSLHYRITNYRIDFERGLLGKRIDTLELWHVEDITFTQSLMSRIFGYGTITIVSHDPTTPRLVINGIPNARATFDLVKQRIIAVKRQRGVIKMDTGT